MFSFSGAIRIALVLSALPLAGASLAHEGHDHGSQPTTRVPVAPRASSVSDALEVLVVVRAGVATIHVDRFATNEPVAGATIEVETPEGQVRAQATEPGRYTIPAPWSAKAGEYDLTITVNTDGGGEVFPVTLDIHDEERAAPAPARTSWFASPALANGIREKLGQDGPLTVLASFLAGVLVAALLLRRRARGTLASVALLALASMLTISPVSPVLAHEGHGEASGEPSPPALSSRDQAERGQDGNLFVPKPTQHLLRVRTIVSEAKSHPIAVELPGRIIADPNGSGLVQSAQGGRLSAPPSGFPRLGTRVRKGDVLAYATPPVQLVDSSDMLQSQSQLDQQITIVERRVTRFQQLAKSAIVSQVQLDEALAELRGLRERRAALDRIRAQPEALIAPIDGVVSEVNAVAGQIAQPSAIVFQILDPKRLIVEALSFEAPSTLGNATARPASGETFGLKLLGAGYADRNQAVPVHFAVDGGDTSGLRIGQFVTVTASRDEGKTGIAVPRASVVRGGNGQNMVFEKTGPERFEPREVRVEQLDGENLIVAQGLESGRRIVTGGAELLNQIR